MKQLYNLLIILLFCYTSAAEVPTQTVIDSDKLLVNYETNIANFIGNVKITKKDTVITCDKAVIYSEKQNLNASPAQGQRDIQKIEFFDNIVIHQANKLAKGELGEYNAKEEIITLLKNVSLTEDGSYLEGDKLIYNLKTKTAKVVTYNKNNSLIEDRVKVFIPDN
jgi:lipopolysaccharide transport protein LptA